MTAIECNPIPDDLDDWTKAPFPVNITKPNGGGYLLLAAVGETVIGCRYYGSSLETAAGASSSDWLGDGAFSQSRNAYPTMNLPLPPALRAARIAEIDAAIAEIDARLAAHPDAPKEWRTLDKAKATVLQGERDMLDPRVIPEAPADAS